MQYHESFASGVKAFPAPLERQQENGIMYSTPTLDKSRHKYVRSLADEVTLLRYTDGG
jgi:hypothetical protein